MGVASRQGHHVPNYYADHSIPAIKAISGFRVLYHSQLASVDDIIHYSLAHAHGEKCDATMRWLHLLSDGDAWFIIWNNLSISSSRIDELTRSLHTLDYP